MLIKIINFARASDAPRPPAHLRRQLRYLFTPQLSRDPDLNRLLGPPLLDHLILTHGVFGTDIELAANDLANQFDFYAREAGVCQQPCSSFHEPKWATPHPELRFVPEIHPNRPNCAGLKSCLGRKRPTDWYVHMIFSFAPFATADLRSPSDPHSTPRKHASSAGNAIRIARDALKLLGWSGTQPGVFVVHGDREHIHVHAVIATPVFGGAVWDVFNFSRQELFDVASMCREAFALSTETPKLQMYYKRWERISNDAETE